MGKGIGLIGNFKGKVGNTVGYKLSASNTGNTQGIRVYQPIVRNPKTSAQAEQRAKLAPINATYRALKMVIDRGNEGLPYGNKSRLAWLKQALKAESMPWINKGGVITHPVLCQLTKGSLAGVTTNFRNSGMQITASSIEAGASLATIGAVSTALLDSYPSLKAGDQITIVDINIEADAMIPNVFSFVIDTNSKVATDLFTAVEGAIIVAFESQINIGTVIVSREGDNGQHLRSTSYLNAGSDLKTAAPYDETSKAAAVESYMSAASANSDWAEESIQ